MTNRSPDALLTDTRWLRRVTRGLVRDPDLAEDVAQETLLAAQMHPAGRERSWLARVARNLAISLLRRETRRTRAESSVSKTSATTQPPPDELLAEAELQRAAVDALMELEEPYRRTLLLRFMKGLSLRAVARQMDVPLETVRTRQKRGLAQLRARLDQRSGGRLALILPLAVPGWPFPSTASLWGFVLMKTKVGVASAVLLLFAAMFGAVAWAGGEEEGYRARSVDGMSARGGAPETSPPKQEMVASEKREPLPSAGEPSNDGKPKPAAETGSLLVRVTWKDTGKPAVNVGVRILPWRDPKTQRPGHQIPWMSRTGPEGTVRFGGLNPGRAAVCTDRYFDSHAVEIKAGVESTHHFVLGPGVDVCGVVVDYLGTPVQGAEVLTRFAAVSPSWTYSVATTGRDGQFLLRGLHKYTFLGARKAGVGISDFMLMLYPRPKEDGVAEIRLVLSPHAATVRGVVLDAEGVPVPDAWVKLRQQSKSEPGGWMHPPTNHVSTDASGRFEVTTLRPGAASLRVFARGHAPYHQDEIECDAFRAAELTIRLVVGTVLSGRVLDDRGYPVGGADVNLPKLEHPTKAHARTDGLGAFRLVDLPAGRHLVTVKSKTAGVLEQTVELPVGKELQHDFTLNAGHTILGVLVDQGGQPLRGWWVSEHGDKHLDTAKTDSEGRFRFTNCEDRAYDLAVRQDWGFRVSGLITVLRGVRPDGKERSYQVEDALLPSAVVRGRVLAADGKPLRGAVVSLKKDEARFWQQVADTDAEGRFESVKVSPGTYRLIIGHIHHQAYTLADIVLRRNAEKSMDDVFLKGRK